MYSPRTLARAYTPLPERAMKRISIVVFIAFIPLFIYCITMMNRHNAALILIGPLVVLFALWINYVCSEENVGNHGDAADVHKKIFGPHTMRKLSKEPLIDISFKYSDVISSSHIYNMWEGLPKYVLPSERPSERNK